MSTPLEHYPDLAAAIGVTDVYFKREDLHPYGSHKGRSIPLMIDHYVAAGDHEFVISSSGNAALAAAIHVNKIRSATPVTLDIFVGNHVSPKKLEKIKKVADEADGAIRILAKERPLQAVTQAIGEGKRSLRQSTDDLALVGYESLAEEIAGEAASKKLAAIFIGTSSGTTAQALATYFSEHKLPIQVHIVQTSSCHPMAAEFTPYDGPEERSLADAIVDTTAQRKSPLLPSVVKTGGSGWIATNDDIIAAQGLVHEHTGLDISTNSALSIVGAMKAVYTGHEIEGPVICLICGD